MSLESFVYGWDEVGSHARLHHVSVASRVQRGAHVVRVLMHRENHKLRSNRGALEPPGCLDTVQARHRDVEHHHIGIERRRSCDEVQTVGDRADNLELAGKNIGGLGQDLGMIVSDSTLAILATVFMNVPGVIGRVEGSSYCQF